MKYRRLDKNSITVYFSERDMQKYDIDFSVFLTPNNQEEAQQLVYRLLSEVDQAADFTGEQQLSIQMLPAKSGKGFLLSVRKFNFDENTDPSEMMEELLNAVSDHDGSIATKLEETMKVAEELMKEEEEDEVRYIRERTPLLLAQTTNLADLAYIGPLKPMHLWKMRAQTLLYHDGVYTLISEYPKGTSDEVVDSDRLMINEVVSTILMDKKDYQFSDNDRIAQGKGAELMMGYANEME